MVVTKCIHGYASSVTAASVAQYHQNEIMLRIVGESPVLPGNTALRYPHRRGDINAVPCVLTYPVDLYTRIVRLAVWITAGEQHVLRRYIRCLSSADRALASREIRRIRL